jgi:hypothetical protein
MKTIPPAQTEHQLTAVADRFDEWRQTRTTRAEPIPQHLWEQAIALTTMFAITHVATRLRVSGGELKKRCAAHHACIPPLGRLHSNSSSRPLCLYHPCSPGTTLHHDSVGGCWGAGSTCGIIPLSSVVPAV